MDNELNKNWMLLSVKPSQVSCEQKLCPLQSQIPCNLRNIRLQWSVHVRSRCEQLDLTGWWFSVRCINLNLVKQRKKQKKSLVKIFVFLLFFCSTLITCQAVMWWVGVHRSSCLISSWPSTPASQMPRLPAHCLQTAIKSSIVLGPTHDHRLARLVLLSPSLSSGGHLSTSPMSLYACFIHSHWQMSWLTKARLKSPT